MLSDQERDALQAAAQRGETGFALEVVRSLARGKRVAEIPDAIETFARHAEINQTPVRKFLAHRVPGILTNHYFSSVVPAFQDFIDWSVHHPQWAEPLIQASFEGDGRALVEAVQHILDEVVAPSAGTRSA